MNRTKSIARAALLAAAAGLGSLAAQTPTATPDVALPHGSTELLWPSGAPGAVGTTDEDKPRLEIFNASGPGLHTAVIVCPGGGYTHLAYEKEGTRIAEWLNLRGISAFVLTYRLAPRYMYPAPIDDGKRSVRWLRAHAAEYHVDPARVGMWGFSAGGHMVGMIGTHFDAGSQQAPDAIDHQSDRPDFVISSYGLLSLDASAARPGQLQQFVKGPITPALVNELSPDKNVTKDTPPFFLYATENDEKVPVMTDILFYAAMKRAGAPVEMHLFEQGPHGTALAQSYPALSEWTTQLENWLKLHNWVRYAAPVQ